MNWLHQHDYRVNVDDDAGDADGDDADDDDDDDDECSHLQIVSVNIHVQMNHLIYYYFSHYCCCYYFVVVRDERMKGLPMNHSCYRHVRDESGCCDHRRAGDGDDVQGERAAAAAAVDD